MQHHTFKNAVSDVETKPVYMSRYYTVVKATVKVVNGDGIAKEVEAEGVARRSWKDVPDVRRGVEIATGRAIKALASKLNGERPRHLLMNG